MVTALPEMVARPEITLYESGRPESDVPISTKGGSLAAPFEIAGNVIVWAVRPPTMVPWYRYSSPMSV
jgi:hypothetical protein